MANSTTYGNTIYYEPISGNSLTQFIRSLGNTQASESQPLLSAGTQSYGSGQQVFGQGLNAMSPVLDYLTKLTKGDQADIQQATQSQRNAIQDSFAAVRNMISSQPRGGGKAGVLAEAPYQMQKQIGDMQSQARQGAANQLGNLSATLAGLGLSQSQLGLGEQGLAGQFLEDAAGTALQREKNDIEESAATKDIIGNIVQGAATVGAAALQQ